MKCIALITSFVVMALAEPEPFFGLGLGYAGVGRPMGLGYAGVRLPISRYAGAYGPGPFSALPNVYGNAHITSTPIVRPAPVAAVPVAVPAAVPAVPYASTAHVRALPSTPSTIQFHKQDELGNYEYGYDNVNSAKHETGNAHVGVRGSYTVKDIYGPRTINYVADALGFRASPAHLRKKRSLFYPYGGIPYSHPIRTYSNAFNAPLTYTVPAPIASPIPAVSTSPVHVSTALLKAVPSAPSTVQHHRQDELGNYEYSYQNANSAKHESGNAYTGVTGGYSYRDAFGIERSINYVADAHGFRVTPTLLRHKRQAAIVPSDLAATRPAVMMKIELNPGHATFYRVY
jgi:hypothetical protein